ncbi:MAG TPA: metalloregulator ArsR/SmtB family transcription factor [Pyrinomonadaceae bacterium]|jgi:DNA-binding transcriptional ArsR family regulator|nr:metalloregulator ArsR/SmtB family transcription factor [Pyrinomonadaceae bacterium]
MNPPVQAEVFTALADPMRRALLSELAENSPRTATQFAGRYQITRQGILKHLNVLRDAGLVTVHQKGREKRYSLTPAPLGDLDKWMKQLEAKWDKRLSRLKTLLENEGV